MHQVAAGNSRPERRRRVPLSVPAGIRATIVRHSFLFSWEEDATLIFMNLEAVNARAVYLGYTRFGKPL